MKCRCGKVMDSSKLLAGKYGISFDEQGFEVVNCPSCGKVHASKKCITGWSEKELEKKLKEIEDLWSGKIYKDHMLNEKERG